MSQLHFYSHKKNAEKAKSKVSPAWALQGKACTQRAVLQPRRLCRIFCKFSYFFSIFNSRATVPPINRDSDHPSLEWKLQNNSINRITVQYTITNGLTRKLQFSAVRKCICTHNNTQRQQLYKLIWFLHMLLSILDLVIFKYWKKLCITAEFLHSMSYWK